MLKVKKLHPDAKLPTVAHPGEDLAYDLYALEDTVLNTGWITKVRTGIAAQAYRYYRITGSAPHYYPVLQENINHLGLLIRDRSSMASKGITVSGGVIDHGYTGEISVLMTDNHYHTHLSLEGSFDYERGVANPEYEAIRSGYKISKGDRIAQMIPIPVLTGEVVEVEELGESSRGDAGFGSTGQ